MNKMNKKGFTLAELLIVVAIIAVLVAVSIPVFTKQLEKSREETDMANLRSAYAYATTDALTGSYKNVDSSSALAPYQEGTGGTYFAFYNIKQGTLTSSATDAGNGKGTGTQGGCDPYDGPMFYKDTVVANSGHLMVVIKEETGAAATIWAGFTKNNTSTGASSDFNA